MQSEKIDSDQSDESRNTKTDSNVYIMRLRLIHCLPYKPVLFVFSEAFRYRFLYMYSEKEFDNRKIQIIYKNEAE